MTGEDGGERANLRGADLAGADLRDANLILIGWETRHLDDPNLHDDCLSLVQRAETMAIARGWKLEPEQEGRRD